MTKSNSDASEKCICVKINKNNPNNSSGETTWILSISNRAMTLHSYKVCNTWGKRPAKLSIAFILCSSVQQTNAWNMIHRIYCCVIVRTFVYSTWEVQKQKQFSSLVDTVTGGLQCNRKIYFIYLGITLLSFFLAVLVQLFVLLHKSGTWTVSASLVDWPLLQHCNATKSDPWPACYHSLTLTRTLNNPGPGIVPSCRVCQWTVRCSSPGQWGRNLTWPQSSLYGDASPPRTSVPHHVSPGPAGCSGYK